MARLTSELILSLIDRVTAPARNIAGAVQNLQGRLETNTRRLDAMRGRMVEAGVVAYGLARAISAPITAATKFESKLEDIGQKAGISVAELPRLGSAIRLVARDATQSATAIAEGMDVLTGMGASEGDALGMLPAIGRAATAYNASIADLSQAGYAALTNLKVPAQDFARALDAMAQAGKAGAFELKDMSQYFPALGAGYQALGQTGVGAVADLAAALQVVRKGTGDSSTAAGNLQNVLQKIGSPATTRAFKKMGVNLAKEMAKATKRGLTPIEAIAEITQNATKGDLGKIGYLFEDAQVQQGLRSIIQNIDEYRRIRAEAMKAQGVVEEDYQRRLQTGAMAAQRWAVAIENLNLAIGAALLPALASLGETLIPIVNQMSAWAEAHPALTRAIVATTAGLVALRIAAIAAQFSLLWMRGGVLSAGVVALGGLASAARATGASMKAMQTAATGGAARALAVEAAASARALTSQTAAAFASARGMQALARDGKVVGVSLKDANSALQVAGREAAAAQVALAAANTQLRATGPAARAAAIGLAVVRGAMSALKLAVIGTGIGAVLVGIAAAGTWIYQNWSGIKEMFAGIGEGIRAAFPGAAAMIDTVSGAVGRLSGWFAKLTGPITATSAEWRAFGVTVGTTIGNVIATVTALPGQLMAILSSVDLSAAGLAMMQSLLNGIVSGATAVLDYARSIGSSIKNAVSGAASSALSSVKSAVGIADAPAIAGARAAGGPVAGGQTYLVGEEGPELFTSSRSGTIIPNGGTAPSAGGGSVSVSFGNIIIQNATNAEQIARELGQRLKDEFAGGHWNGGYRVA